MNGSRNRYTHNAWFNGIPCYYNVESDSLTGTNRIFNIWIDLHIYAARWLRTFNYDDMITLGKELPEGDRWH